MDEPGFTTTHTVPAGGLPAWHTPDPSIAAAATLGERLPVQVVERAGAWARVVCSNGWTGWVDGRLLVASETEAASAEAPAATSAEVPTPMPAAVQVAPAAPGRQQRARPGRARLGVPRSPAQIGAALVFISAVLPWIRGAGFLGSNAFDVRLLFLFGSSSDLFRGLSAGLVLLALGAAGLWTLRTDAAKGPSVRRSVGVAAVVLAVWFAIRALAGIEGFRITRLGYGVYSAIVGGALLVWSSIKAEPRTG